MASGKRDEQIGMHTSMSNPRLSVNAVFIKGCCIADRSILDPRFLSMLSHALLKNPPMRPTSDNHSPVFLILLLLVTRKTELIERACFQSVYFF